MDVKKIGITGGIGSGKSVVARIVRSNSFPVYDCDSEARRIMEKDPAVAQQLKAILGEECYDEGGNLNRPYVASKIFGNPEYREAVNKVVHSAVRNDFIRFAERARGKVFVESAILGSSGLADLCDEIWLVEAPEEERISRVKLRNGLSEEAVKERMAAQISEMESLPNEKIRHIDNADNAALLANVLPLIAGEVQDDGYVITV